MPDPTTTNHPPLWREMAEAYRDVETAATTAREIERLAAFGIAAEIRAIAEWIKQRQVEDYAATLPRPHHTDVREVIGWLTAEADRAERGEGEHV